MGRVLYVASLNPFRTGGGSQATLAYLQSIIDIFGAANVDVMIGEEYQIAEEYREINYIKVPVSSILENIRNLIFSDLSRFTVNIVSYIKKNKGVYDIVILNRGDIAGNAVKKLNKLGVRTCVIHHNYEVEYHIDNKTILTLNGHYGGIIRRAEYNAYINANINLFLTRQDLLMFEKQYGKCSGKCHVIGCFETKDSIHPNSSSLLKDFDIAVSGTLANYQTVCGIEDLDNHYIKIIKELIPNAQIILTGRNPDNKIREIANQHPNLYNVVPNPNDILSQVNRAKIYLCPTNIGGGLKLRAMDGLKCGLPVLIHSVSSRGYDSFWNKPYFQIYKDELSFREGLSNILRYMEITPNGQNEIKNDFNNYFGYANGVKRMKDFLNG